MFLGFWCEAEATRRGCVCMESYSGQMMLAIFDFSIFRFDSVSLGLAAEFTLVSDSE